MRKRTATTAAIVLSLAAVGAPAASARPVDLAPASQQSSAAVYSRPDKATIPTSPPTGSGGAVDSSTARRLAGLSAYREGQIAASFDAASLAASRASAPQSVVRVHASQGGFDWGDAGLGAAGALALSVIAVGGAFVASGRRGRRGTAVPN